MTPATVKQLEEGQSRLSRADFHGVLSQAGEALVAFAQVPEGKSHRAMCHNLLAAASGGLHRFNDQATHARTAISLLLPTTELVKTLASANFNLARGMMNAGDPKGAVPYMEAARDLLVKIPAGSNEDAPGLLAAVYDDLKYLASVINFNAGRSP